MTISTGLFYDRAVSQLSTSKSDLAKLQEKVATGKELNRASDSVDTAVNVSRLKSAIANLDGFANSLNSVNDKLRVEESYIQGVSDVLTKIKTLTIQGANASYNASDRKVIALEIRELTDEIKNLANGIDPSGNYLFAGTRVRTAPYQEDESGIIRYQGDQVETKLNFTKTRTSVVGRSGPDVFQAVTMGQQPAIVPAQYEVAFSGKVEAGDQYTLLLDGQEFAVTASGGQNIADLLASFEQQISQAVTNGELSNISVSTNGDQLNVSADDGLVRKISVSALNVADGQNDQDMTVILKNTPDPGTRKMEFFESLQQVADFMETGSQDQIQSKLHHLDQMLDIATQGLADLGVEMATIETELNLNRDLKTSLQATLSSQEDLDYTKTITELQARLLSLEAAQSSFAKISSLSVFDYLR
jgi:flagellar hook-associated protein 3 FlgL